MLLWGLVFTYDDNKICCLMHDEYIINVITDLESYENYYVSSLLFT